MGGPFLPNFTDAVYAKIAEKPDYSATLARTWETLGILASPSGDE